MFKKFKNIFFITIFIVFIFFISKHYFSEEHITFTNKVRSSYTLNTVNNLPLLKNDTNDIIVYTNGLEEFKKSRKKRFWERLISGNNE